MLDLTTTFTKLYEVKLFDGTILHIERPTQAMSEKVMMLSESDNMDEDIAQMALLELLQAIFNKNIDGITFDRLPSEYDVMVAAMVIQDYYDYWNNEVSNNINFQ